MQKMSECLNQSTKVIMSTQQHSASLEIVENNPNSIEITQNSFEIRSQASKPFFEPQKIDDTFQLSLDENSLSFQIEQLKQESTCNKVLKEGNINSQVQVVNLKPSIVEKQQSKPIPLIQEQRKRKRKQIFQKYKQKTTENILADSNLLTNNSDFINTIDEIFKIKSPEKSHTKQSKRSPQITKKQSFQRIPKVQSFGFKKKSQTLKAAITSFEQQGMIGSPSKYIDFEAPLVCKAQKNTSVSEFHIPSQITEQHRIDSTSKVVIGSTNSFLMEPQVNRISIIEPQQEEASRDSVEIETFLRSQIFRDDLLQKTIRKDDTSYKNIQISMVNPSIMINNNFQSPIHNFFNQKGLGLTRDKSETTLHTLSPQQSQQILRRNLSERKIKIFESIHLKPQAIVKEKPLSYEEERIPIYLRQIRKKNTVYPNFFFKSKNKQFYQQQNIAFKELLIEFKKGLCFLDFVNELAYERYNILVSLQKKLLNSLSLETFMTCGFQKVYQIKQLIALKPHQNFIKRKYEYGKVKEALNNYLYIAQYYEKFDLNLEDSKAQKKYLQIRSKFWAIEKNIKMIGQDIYVLAIHQVFPSHYIEFFRALKGQFPQFAKPFQQLEYKRNLLNKYYALRQSGDLLCLSQIGKNFKQRLQKMIQKTIMI